VILGCCPPFKVEGLELRYFVASCCILVLSFRIDLSDNIFGWILVAIRISFFLFFFMGGFLDLFDLLLYAFHSVFVVFQGLIERDEVLQALVVGLGLVHVSHLHIEGDGTDVKDVLLQ